MIKNYNEVLHKNPALESERLLLRKFREEDATDLLEWASDPETVRWLVWEGLSTREEAHASIFNHYLLKPGMFAIEIKETGKCIGAIDLRLIPEHDKASFGYVLNRRYWGKGYMTEVLRTLIAFCFEKLEVNRAEAKHYAGNPASGRVMEKAGMTKEGLLRQSEKVKGIMRDNVLYGIIKEDYFKNCNNICKTQKEE
ncbi:MAG: GNAT family N-acetyltransferase [Defluviitaleaceae bacterium]|nr:GNAT family N-acetyltransferase [Defluviitaleaceae bacterium]MCL2837271.1 GNAT family N-acetyltransferase [Defluviitaleaceae bacterium]